MDERYETCGLVVSGTPGPKGKRRRKWEGEMRRLPIDRQMKSVSKIKSVRKGGEMRKTNGQGATILGQGSQDMRYGRRANRKRKRKQRTDGDMEMDWIDRLKWVRIGQTRWEQARMMNGDGYLLTCVNLFGTGINEFDQTNKKRGRKKKNRKGCW